MNIVVFEDNINEYKRLQDCISTFLKQYDINYKVYKTTKPSHIYENLDKIDLVFLDIEVNSHNGIEIGETIRELDRNKLIIITSSYAKYLQEGYKVKAERYFLKPIEQSFFDIEMKKVINTYLLNNKYIFDLNIDNKKIYHRQIYFVEVLNKKTYLHLAHNQNLEVNLPLSHWEDYFKDDHFVRCHRAFIVNISKISSYNQFEIELDNGYKVPFSRSWKTEFDKAYKKYVFART